MFSTIKRKPKDHTESQNETMAYNEFDNSLGHSYIIADRKFSENTIKFSAIVPSLFR